MRFGSVCSGIEAASVAWHPLGWEAAWLSEIEPFPCAVLNHHYPDVPNHGDMTLLPEKILSGEVEAPDLFCGGTPCQAFSVAGLRNSLDDARGNLSLTFVGIANAIDHVRSVRRDAPAIIFWENVPGVLNTKDNAFGCFLGALAGENDPLIPSGDKWSNAGCVYGPQRTVAWRVLDAQYFGVAQRRRRVFVIASARDDFDPAKVLFEFEGVRRDTAPSRKEGQRPTTSTQDSPRVSSTGLLSAGDCGVDLSGPLSARDYKDAGTDGMNKNSAKMVPVMQEFVGALDTECGGNKMSHQTIASGHLLPVKSFYESSLAQYREANVSGTIKRSGGVAGGGSETFLAQPIPLNTMNLLGREIDDGRRGFGIGDEGDPCPTLTKNHSHAVAQPIPIHDQATRHAGRNGEKTMGKGNGLGIGQEGDPMNTLTKGDRHAVAQPIAMRESGQGYWMEDDKAGTLRAEGENRPSRPSHVIAQPIGFTRCDHGGDAVIDGTPTMRCGSNYSAHLAACIPIAQPIAFHPTQDPISSSDGTTHGLGCGSSGGQASIAIAHPIVLMDQGGSVMNVQTDGTVGTLRRETHGHEPVIVQPTVFNIAPGKGDLKDDIHVTDAYISKTIDAFGSNPAMHQGGSAIVQPVGVDSYNLCETGNLTQTLKSPQGGVTESIGAVRVGMAVRRLTPMECERLQGFPDGYTNIPWRKAAESPDGPRYKALGNSWAVPVVAWIGERIEANLKENACLSQN